MPDLNGAQFSNVIPIRGPRLPHQGDELDQPVCEDCAMGGANFAVKQRHDPIQKRPRQLCAQCADGLEKEAEWQKADRAAAKARLTVVR